MVLVLAEIQLPDLAALRKIDPLEIDPERIGCQRRFEEIELALVIEDGTPPGRRYVRLLSAFKLFHKSTAPKSNGVPHRKPTS